VAGSSLPGWLQLSPSGLLTGTPAAADAGTDTFTLQVTDGTNTVMQSYTILVGGGFNVSGTVSLVNGGGALQGAVVSLGTGLSATTDSSGNFTIAHALAGTYTVTLGVPSAPSSAFYPASASITNMNGTFSITVNSADLTSVNFNAALGFTVSGKLSYAGVINSAKFNTVFISLQPANCNNCTILGTSAPGPTAPFIINGVPPGTYAINAWMDFAGYGIGNAFDPIGTSTVTVGMANVTNVAVALSDPSLVGAIPGPGIKATPIESGVIIQYTPIVQNGVEQPLLYNLQWAAGAGNNAACETAPDGGYIVDASGQGNPIVSGSGRIVILDSQNPASPAFQEFVDTQQYSICMQGLKFNPSVGFTQGGWQPINPAVTIGPPTGGAGTNTVSGNVIIPDTVTPSGDLYAGCYDTKTGKIYSDVILAGNLVIASQGGNPYKVAGVPTGASCFLFAMLDQDGDGVIGPSNPTPSQGSFTLSTAGDIYNTNAHNPATVTITGNTTQDIDLTPFSNNSNPNVSTQHVQSMNLSGSTQESYNLNFLVTPLIGQPKEVTLLQGPNVVAPADFAICTTCNDVAEFNIILNTNGARPQVGDSYVLQITYTDTTLPPDVVTLTVTGVSDAFATSLTPVVSAGTTTPTFSWTDPSNATNYMYQFLLADSTGNTIWQVPGQNAFLNFASLFPSSIVSIPWVTPPSGKDPTGAVNPPSVASLTSGTTYTWSITVVDSNSNTAVKQVAFQP
jgi:hypothetical protein